MPQWIAFGAGVFGLIFLLELPDKTALASLLLATRHPPLPIFVGAALAFVVQSVVAVFAGSLLGLLPREPVRIAAGLFFFVLAALALRTPSEQLEAEEAQEVQRIQRRFHRPLFMAFAAVFTAEWGDLTQLATATLQARYRQPVLIFIAATLALWAATAVAVTAGNRLGRLVPERPLRYAAAGVMVIVGALLIAGVLG